MIFAFDPDGIPALIERAETLMRQNSSLWDIVALDAIPDLIDMAQDTAAITAADGYRIVAKQAALMLGNAEDGWDYQMLCAIEVEGMGEVQRLVSTGRTRLVGMSALIELCRQTADDANEAISGGGSGPNAIEWMREPEKDAYHSMAELYEYRMLFHAHAANLWAQYGIYPVVKSLRHHDGEACFGGKMFIVVAEMPTGQTSNHYPLSDWDRFVVPEVELAPVWDGHDPQIAAERLRAALTTPEEN